MEPTRKIKVSIVVKQVTDKQDIEIADRNSDGYLVLAGVKRALDSFNNPADEESSDKILRVLDAAKLSNEIMASALIDVDREDLFNEKVDTIRSIDDIIKFINTL
jgi:malonyl CoA-acyl carrier protein transacylase